MSHDTSVKQVILHTTPLTTIHAEEIGIKENKENLKKLAISPYRLRLWNHWIKIDNDFYYFKGMTYIYAFLNELIGEQISRFFELDTIHYQLAEKVFADSSLKCFGLLSKNFRLVENTYFEATDLNFSRYYDFALFEHLKEYNENGKYTLLLSDLKKMVIRDLYTNQKDRLTDNNFFFHMANGVLRLSPLHDYENSFEEVSLERINLFSHIDLNIKKYRDYIENDEEFSKLIQKIFLIDMKKILNFIENSYQIYISDYYKNQYLDYDNEMKEKIYRAFS